MRKLLLAAGAALSLAGGAQAASVFDATGDFLPSYTGAGNPTDADLDVTFFSVSFDADDEVFRVRARMAGDIDPARPGLYAIGVNTGTGVIDPFGDIGNGDVIFNNVIAVMKTGAAFVVGGSPLTATIDGAALSFVVPLSALPSTGFRPNQYGFNIWPRVALAANSDISDFAPDNAMLTAVPEPATWAVMLVGFGVLGGMLRARRGSAAPTVLA